MKTYGSQNRDELADSGYTVNRFLPCGDVILQNENGKLERWTPNNDFAGYVVEINGLGYEFVSSIIVPERD